MKKNISPLLRSKIETNIKKYTCSENNPQYLRDLARELEILPLFLDMSVCFGLRSNGEIVSFHFDSEFEPHIEEDLRNVNIALHQGSKLYPELKTLVPSKPQDAKICHFCNGTGFESGELHPEVPLVCYCGGLGWLPSYDITTPVFEEEYRIINRR